MLTPVDSPLTVATHRCAVAQCQQQTPLDKHVCADCWSNIDLKLRQKVYARHRKYRLAVQVALDSIGVTVRDQA